MATLRSGAKLHRRRTYDDRRINSFADGFTVQYSINVVAHNGKRTSLSACLVGQCREGRIWQLDEYLDSGKFAAQQRDQPEQSP